MQEKLGLGIDAWISIRAPHSDNKMSEANRLFSTTVSKKIFHFIPGSYA